MVAIDPPTSAVVIFGDENDEIVKLLNTSASQFLSLGDNKFIFLKNNAFQKTNITPLLFKFSSAKIQPILLQKLPIYR
jgi:hypothetical protein